MMEVKEISERLVAIHAALTDKLGGQPYLEPSLTINQSGRVYVRLYKARVCECLETAAGETIAGALDAADAFIAALPDRGETQKREFHKDLGKLIDRGREIDMDPEVMAPLTNSMDVLSENLLTYQPAE